MQGRQSRRAGRHAVGRHAGRWGAFVLAAATMAAGGATARAGASPSDCPILAVPGCAEPTPVVPTTTSTVPAATTTSAPATTTTVATTSTTVLTEPAAAARLLELVNRARVEAGAPPLGARADVADIAQAWSGELARRGALAHNDDYFSRSTRTRLRAKALGENVARAGDVEAAHRALMASPGHRANILDARFRIVGIGAVLRSGTWWFTQDFVEPVAGPSSVPAADELPRSAPAGASRPTTTASPAERVIEAAGAGPSEVVVLDAVAPAPPDDERAVAATLAPAGEAVATGRWMAIGVGALAMPLLVLTGHARRRLARVDRRPPEESAVDDSAPESDDALDRMRHHLSVIDAWISTLDDRWTVLTEKDRRIAVQVIRRNAHEALGVHPLA